MEEIISFGHWLKQRRQALHLTQQALAGLVCCSTELIRKLEADARRPSPEVAERLARHLALPPEQWPTFVRVARAELRVASLPSPTPAPSPLPQPSPGGSRSPLPMPATPLLGRAEEVAELHAQLLRPDVRLLTLTGAPGIGKTRLGLQVAAEAHEAFVDGVCFVALAPLRDPDGLAAALVQGLGIQATGTRPLAELLTHHLRKRRLLLVLDNFEHVLTAAPLVSELLAVAPHLTVLATSRASLRISGEHVYIVPPLALPDHSQPAAPGELTRYAAVELFVQRARAAAPGFALTSGNATAVSAICRRLDGLPLAIELAAARVRLLEPRALLARLSDRLSLLTGGPRDLPPRQQALRSTIDWSFELLDVQEQALLRGMAVFVDGCTLEAAEAVLGGAGQGAPEDRAAGSAQTHVLDGLGALLDKSLLTQREGTEGTQRLGMLETIRDYALERLAEQGETEALRARHAAYYAALVQEAAPHIWQSPQGMQAQWLARLGAEQSNLRAGLEWSVTAAGTAELGLELAADLWPYWLLQGQIREGRAWLTALLTRTAQQGTRQRALADALRGLGTLALHQNDYPAATAAFGACLAVAEERGDGEAAVSATYNLGIIASFQGDYAEARGRLEACLMRWRATGNREGSAGALHSLGDIAWHQGDYAAMRTLHEESLELRRGAGEDIDLYAVGNLHSLGRLARAEGDLAQARALCEASLALARERGFQAGVLWALHDLGEVARDDGDDARATASYEASLRIAHELGSPAWAASMQNRLGEVAQAAGEYERAAALHRESLRVFRDLGQKRDTLLCLEGLAWVAGAQEQLTRSAMLYGAVAALRAATGAQVPPRDRARYTKSAERVRTCLGEAVFRVAWSEGYRMPLAQACAVALDEHTVVGDEESPQEHAGAESEA